MYQYSACPRLPVACSSAGHASTPLPVLRCSTVANGICHRKANILASHRLCVGRSGSDPVRTSSSNASDDGPAVARVASLAAAALLVLPAGGSYAAADLAAAALAPTEQQRPIATYNSDTSSLQLVALPAPSPTAALVPATPFQAPKISTPPAVADPKAPPASSQDSKSSCDPSASTQLPEGSSGSSSLGPLDPPTPPNSPMTPPPPHAPLPTPQQPHFPLLPNSPPPALPPQLLPPCDQPPPTKLIPRSPSDSLQQGGVKPVGLGAGLLATSSSGAYSTPYSDLGMLPAEAAQAVDSPVSLLQLYKSEQQLQEQRQDVLMYTAMAEGSTSGLAVQEPPALPLPGDVPLPYFDRDLTQSEWQAATAESGVTLYASLIGNGTSTVAALPSYVAGEPGLLSAASFEDKVAAVAAGSADSAVGDRLQASQGSSAQQQQLSGSKLSDDIAIQQVLEAVPAAAHCPEAATAAPVNCGSAASSKGSSTATSQEEFAASSVVGTATDSSTAGQGSTGIPVTPMQGGGAAAEPAAATGGSAAVTNTAPTETLQSAKAAKDIKKGIKSAREQIAARSKQLEYESPGYEQLLDASKRLLIALIAIAQFLIKVALSLGVYLVKGLVQLIQWFLNR